MHMVTSFDMALTLESLAREGVVCKDIFGKEQEAMLCSCYTCFWAMYVYVLILLTTR